MTWSILDLLRRRHTAAGRPSAAKRKSPPNRWRPLLEVLEDRTVPSTYTVSQTLNTTAIAPGDVLWFSSAASGMTGVGSSPANIWVTNQKITFSDTNGGVTTNYSLTVPDALLTVTPGGTSAATTFNSSLNQWVTNVPTGLGLKLFMSGYALALPSGLHGGDIVTWTATFTTNSSGVTFNWQWAAAAYTSFNSSYGSIGVKPCDNASDSIYLNSDNAGSPESYKTHVIAGGTGGGGSNYTGSFSSSTAVTPTLPVTISGTVYQDAADTGVYATGDSGIGGVTLTLTGTTTLGQSVTATTTSAANGSFIFVTDVNGDPLQAGTYQITESRASGSVADGASVGTVNGSADGTVVSTSQIGSIVIAGSQSAVNYNFLDVQPVTLSGTVYQDTNDSGVYSSSDPGLAGVTVTLSGTNIAGQSITSTTTSSATGAYTFTTDSSGNLLLPGTYQITEAKPNGYMSDDPTPGTVSGTISISGTAYIDASGNGFSSSNTPQAGVTIYLYNSTSGLGTGSGYYEETTTAADGTYSFANLSPGTYYVQAAVPSGYVQTGGGPNGTAGSTYYTVAGTTGLAYSGYNFADYLIPVNLPTSVSFTVTTPGNSSTTVTSLGSATQQGDTVTVTFTVPSGTSETVTLVSYIAPGPSFSDATAYEQLIYRQAGGTFGAGTHTLTVQLPNCDYQIDFVAGSVLTQIEPSQNGNAYGPDSANVSYHSEGR